MEEDRIVADVCHGDRCTHLRPHLGVKPEVFVTVLRTESDNGSETLEAWRLVRHCSSCSPLETRIPGTLRSLAVRQTYATNVDLS
jgi:hypothetical protein